MRRIRRRLGLRSKSAGPWLVWAARFGYAACGFIYLVMGLAAIAVAVGLAEEPTGSHGIMEFLSRQPFAPLLLGALGIGLAGYATLNIVGAISDPERRGISPGALIMRSIDILTGALYVTLTVTALGFLVGYSSDNATAGIIAERLSGVPLGRAVLWLTALALVISSGYLLVRAMREEFGEMLDRREMSKRAHRMIELAARAGTAARAVIFMICGLSALRAARGKSPDIGDVGDALAFIGSAAFGQVILAFVGAGFVAYGLYQLGKARYQRVVDAPPA